MAARDYHYSIESTRLFMAIQAIHSLLMHLLFKDQFISIAIIHHQVAFDISDHYEPVFRKEYAVYSRIFQTMAAFLFQLAVVHSPKNHLLFRKRDTAIIIRGNLQCLDLVGMENGSQILLILQNILVLLLFKFETAFDYFLRTVE